MVLKVFAGLIAVLALFCVYVLIFVPTDFKIERSTHINAPAQAVFPYVNNTRKTERWNPFTKKDPNLKMTFTGPEDGVGSTSAWDGDKNVGAGSAKIIESEENKRVVVQLEFVRPFAATNRGEYLLTPDATGTVVTWSMSGVASFFPRAVCAVLGWDKMVGPDFERGLSQLKVLVEQTAH